MFRSATRYHNREPGVMYFVVFICTPFRWMAVIVVDVESLQNNRHDAAFHRQRLWCGPWKMGEHMSLMRRTNVSFCIRIMNGRCETHSIYGASLSRFKNWNHDGYCCLCCIDSDGGCMLARCFSLPGSSLFIPSLSAFLLFLNSRCDSIFFISHFGLSQQTQHDTHINSRNTDCLWFASQF